MNEMVGKFFHAVAKYKLYRLYGDKKQGEMQIHKK
jgi:hypothetical protein